MNSLVLLGMAMDPGSLGRAMELMVVGMGVVFAALTLIYFMMALMQRVLGGSDAVVEAESSMAAGTEEVPPGVSPLVLAAISAAVVVAIKYPHRIRNVRLIRTAPPSAWAEHGRAQIHQSHSLQKG